MKLEQGDCTAPLNYRGGRKKQGRMQGTDGKMVSLCGLAPPLCGQTLGRWKEQVGLSLPLLQNLLTSGPDARIIFPLTKKRRERSGQQGFGLQLEHFVGRALVS